MALAACVPALVGVWSASNTRSWWEESQALVRSVVAPLTSIDPNFCPGCCCCFPGVDVPPASSITLRMSAPSLLKVLEDATLKEGTKEVSVG